MKSIIGPSILALAIAQPDTAGQPPAASENQPALPAGSADQMSPSESAGSTAANDAKLEKTYTKAEVEDWVGKRIYSSDGNDIGEIAAIEEGSDGKVNAFHADIGGFLGLGETRVRVKPSQLSQVDDKLTLPMTGEEAKNLPRVAQ